MLLVKSHSAIEHARRYLIIFIGYDLFLVVAGIVGLSPSKFSPAPAAWTGLWLTYLNQSKRVALTYRRCNSLAGSGEGALGGGTEVRH